MKSISADRLHLLEREIAWNSPIDDENIFYSDNEVWVPFEDSIILFEI